MFTSENPRSYILKNDDKINEKQDPMCYNDVMKKEQLSKTNPYLRDKSKRMSGLIATVCSSSAIEGIAAQNVILNYLIKTGQQPIPHKPAKTD